MRRPLFEYPDDEEAYAANMGFSEFPVSIVRRDLNGWIASTAVLNCFFALPTSKALTPKQGKALMK